ncbi:phosphodiesterase [Aliihoeflea sp. 40Bstr573]|jgi:3',5'-cyclic-AMP phosphodiesterase|uniref:phosphodiesterase n=1 Tax=Aliihoeflea sp. 40Bstr573 TaxID=2696467 RepID=UPI0020951177|nr:phosphodiesterase [Aliihoeflea sp. 40Bstr573]MCO6387089.1 phosphodiesterase [Aliihoeflea sp. 40Bstr573]
MKIVQITDLHLAPPGQRVFGLDPWERLDACLTDVNRHHADADLVVFTGDLAHNGEEVAYSALKMRLQKLKTPYRLLIGNHDNRAMFRQVFPEAPVDEAGFVQSSFKTEAGIFIFLDTNEIGTHAGRLCSQRLAWLDEALAEHPEPAFLFMHHPPLPLHLAPMDAIMLKDANAFDEILTRHGQVRHIFLGHVHRPISGNWRGIPFSCLRGTNHQVWLDFEVLDAIPCSLEPPAYAIAFIQPDQVVVHTHDFLDASPKYAYDPDLSPDTQVKPAPASI